MRRVEGVVEIIEELRRGLVGLREGGARVFPDHAHLRAGREPPGVHGIHVEGVVGVVAVALVGHRLLVAAAGQAGEIGVAHVAAVLAHAQRERHAVGERVGRRHHVGHGGHGAAAQ